MIRGAVAKHLHRHDELISAAWHAAKLTAYAPEKARDFITLDKLLVSRKPKTRSVPSWRAVLAKVQGWVG